MFDEMSERGVGLWNSIVFLLTVRIDEMCERGICSGYKLIYSQANLCKQKP